jgi:hypothetical protein
VAAVQAARGNAQAAVSGAVARAADGGGGAVARAADGGGRRPAAQHGGGGDGGESEGEGAVKTERRQKRESERVAVSRQESNMTCGPRRFSYRRLIRRLGFEHRLISSV